LDKIANDRGVAARFSASASSVYQLVVADAGTVYAKVSNTFTGSHGVVFEMEDNTFTVPSDGYGWLKLRSTSTGRNTIVNPLSINKVSSAPSGHIYTINEVIPIGGRDAEEDDMFRMRIKNGANLGAVSTLARLTQAFMKVNNNVLRLFYYGINDNGKVRIAIATQNGIDLDSTELAALSEVSEEVSSIYDIRPYGIQTYGMELLNISWDEISVDFRVQLLDNYDVDSVRKDIQIKMGKYLDPRYWMDEDKVEWDDLLGIVKSASGIGYTPDAYFTPRQDFYVQSGKLPRIKSFIMRDMNGVAISDSGGNLNPIYFPNKPDYSYQSTILKSISWQ